MTADLGPSMRGYTPVTERTLDSEVLDRRIMLAKVPLLSDDDLRAFRLELQDTSASLREQLAIHSESEDSDWLRRARAKRRLIGLFVVACGEEAERRLALLKTERKRILLERDRLSVEQARLKTIRTLNDQARTRRRAAKLARVVNTLLIEEWGEERTKAFYEKASAITDTLLDVPTENDLPPIAA